MNTAALLCLLLPTIGAIVGLALVYHGARIRRALVAEGKAAADEGEKRAGHLFAFAALDRQGALEELHAARSERFRFDRTVAAFLARYPVRRAPAVAVVPASRDTWRSPAPGDDRGTVLPPPLPDAPSALFVAPERETPTTPR